MGFKGIQNLELFVYLTYKLASHTSGALRSADSEYVIIFHVPFLVFRTTNDEDG